MAETKAVTTTGPLALAVQWNEAQLALVKSVIAPDLTDAEVGLFAEVSSRKGLDPFTNQIYAIVRGKGNNRKLTFQTGIDGYRLIAERTGKYAGQKGPWWCGPDGAWRDVWLDEEPPRAAKVIIVKRDVDGFQEISAIATWDEYAEYNYEWKDGPNGRYRTNNKTLTEMWQRRGPSQLAKCAEALGHRKAFPLDLSGLYTNEEMAQANNPAIIDVTPGEEGAPAAAKQSKPPTQRQQAVSRGKEAMSQPSVREQQAEMEAQMRTTASGVKVDADGVIEGESTPATDDESWLNDLADQIKAWGLRASDALGPIVGIPPTPRIIKEWAKRYTRDNPGKDPFRAICDLVREGDAFRAAHPDEAPATPSTEQAPANDDPDDLPFE